MTFPSELEHFQFIKYVLLDVFNLLFLEAGMLLRWPFVSNGLAKKAMLLGGALKEL